MKVFWVGVLLGGGGGYALSIFTWTKLHTIIIGAEQKAIKLRDQARALEAKLRGK